LEKFLEIIKKLLKSLPAGFLKKGKKPAKFQAAACFYLPVYLSRDAFVNPNIKPTCRVIWIYQLFWTAPVTLIIIVQLVEIPSVQVFSIQVSMGF